MIVNLANEQLTDYLYRLTCYINSLDLDIAAYNIFYKNGIIDKQVLLKIIDEAVHIVENKEHSDSLFAEIYDECVRIINNSIH